MDEGGKEREPRERRNNERKKERKRKKEKRERKKRREKISDQPNLLDDLKHMKISSFLGSPELLRW